MNRQKLTLAILLLILALALLYSFWQIPRQQRVAKLKYTPGVVAETVRTVKPSPLDEKRVHLELLDRKTRRFSGFRRNIFRPFFQEESNSLPQAARLPASPPPPVVPPPPPVVEPTPLQRDLAAFTFLGFLKKEQRKTIFLAKGKEIFLVRKGDRIAGKYEAVEISDEALTIALLEDGGEIVIPLVENMALSAPRR